MPTYLYIAHCPYASSLNVVFIPGRNLYKNEISITTYPCRHGRPGKIVYSVCISYVPHPLSCQIRDAQASTREMNENPGAAETRLARLLMTT